jgi:hypothetical protein
MPSECWSAVVAPVLCASSQAIIPGIVISIGVTVAGPA